MGLPVACLLAALLAAEAAATDEMIVFRKDGPYQGRALRVTSHERKGDKVVLHTADGNLFSVPEGAVDWDATAKQSELLHAKEAEAAATRDAEEATRRQAQARKEEESHPLGLVEASRRYGVDNPGMSVSSGTAAREVNPPAGEKPAAAQPPGAAGEKAAAARLEAAKKDRDAIKRDVDALKADSNPDPLWASKREARLEQKQAELKAAEAKVQAEQRAVDEAKKPSAGK